MNIKTRCARGICTITFLRITSIISGSGQPQIVRTPLENLEITLPSIFEQEQKAMLLDRIQAKIEISNRVLSLYQEQKQYLLRQMFI